MVGFLIGASYHICSHKYSHTTSTLQQSPSCISLIMHVYLLLDLLLGSQHGGDYLYKTDISEEIAVPTISCLSMCQVADKTMRGCDNVDKFDF